MSATNTAIQGNNIPWALMGRNDVDEVPLDTQVDTAWNMSEDEIYQHLGMASLGTSNVLESKASMDMLMTAAADTNGAAATENLRSNLIEKGRNFFQWLWDTVKSALCSAYKDKTTAPDGKDLVKYLVGAIAASFSIANFFLTLLITVLVKKGLDLFCDIETGKPKA